MKLKDNIKGIPGYHITRDGLLYSRYDNKGRLTPNSWKLRKSIPPSKHNGYVRYGFCIRNKRIKFQKYAHRLVAEAYIPNPDNLPVVMHLDNNPKNNKVENLKWGTVLENNLQCIKDGRKVVRKTLIARVISDLHIMDPKKHQSRLDTSFKILNLLADLCEKDKVPLLHCGDLFHDTVISTHLLSVCNQEFSELSKRDFVIVLINGNHGSPKVHQIGKPFESLDIAFSKAFPTLIYVLDYKTYKLTLNNHTLYGVPYIDHNIGLNDYLKGLKLNNSRKHRNILMLHTDYPGAEDTDGRKVDSVENLNLNILNRFDLVLCGHIHKPQRLSKKVYMVGAPYQQRRTDKNTKLGYWELYSDLSMKFVELKGFPKFIDVESEDEIKDDGNYYTVVPKQKTSEQSSTNHKITKQLTKTKLAKRYLKEKGIKDEKKQNLLIRTLKRAEE